MTDLEQKIIEWAEARNLIDGSTAHKQFGKLLEEVQELYAAMEAAKRTAVEGTDATGLSVSQHYVYSEDVADALGDIVVVLTIMARQLGVGPLTACVEGAYEQIKDRKGKLINGVFVKEEDNG